MDRPNFGIGKYFAIKWTPERLAYIRYCAGQKMSAAQIAVDIGLDIRNGPRIAEACKRHSIKLQGRGGRPRHRAVPIVFEVPEMHLPALEKLGAKYQLSKSDVARQLLAAMFDQGEAFLDNLLDLGGAGD